MGGKSGKMGSLPNAPPANWVSLAEYQASTNLNNLRKQAELNMMEMQQEFQRKFEEIQNAYAAIPAPELTEVEDIDWSEKIDEMEVDARADIEAMASMGSVTSTIITSPLVWESEPTVLSNSLLAG